MRLSASPTAKSAERRHRKESTREMMPSRRFDDADVRLESPRESLAEMSDERLMLMVRDVRDETAFTLLESRYDRPLHSYLFKRMHDRAAADDVYQDTWIKVFRRAELFDDSKRFRPWLYSISTNAATDWGRRTKHDREMISLSRDHSSAMSDDLSMMDLVVDDLAAPDDMLLMEEERQRVRDCIQSLPKLQMDVIMMIRYQGLAFREAAQILGIPNGTAKSRYHQGILALEDRLRMKFPEYGEPAQ